MSQIICQNLAIGYDGKAILKDINFSINEGDYLCIIGENGSGKSTLMRTLLHLQQPVSGTILLGDGLQSNEIGYLPQQTAVQKDFPASVREIILSGCQNRVGMRPFYNRSEKKRASEMMEKLQITNLANRCYRELSGGQQQRVLLARALCATSKVILLDEPVTGLDPKVTADFYELLKQLNDKGITVIMVSHDLHAVSYATHILYIDSDDSFYGTKKEFLNSDKADVLGKIKGDDK